MPVHPHFDERPARLRPRVAAVLHARNFIKGNANPLHNADGFLTALDCSKLPRLLHYRHDFEVACATAPDNSFCAVRVQRESRNHVGVIAFARLAVHASRRDALGEAPCRHAMHRKGQLLFQPIQPPIHRRRFGLSVGEDGALRHGRDQPLRGHQCEGAALDACAEGEDVDGVVHDWT